MFTKPTLGTNANYATQVARLIDMVEGPPRRNWIRNGDFQIAQRGTSFAGITAAQYTLDGVWFVGSGTNTITQQSHAVGQTDVPGNPRKYLRVQRTAAAGAANAIVQFPIEFPELLSGKTVTVAAWMRVASGTKALMFDMTGSGVTGLVYKSSSEFTVTTSWQLFTWPVVLDNYSAVTANAALLPRITEGSGFGTFTLDISDIQLEVGSEAPLFERLSYHEQFLWAQRFLPGIAATATFQRFGAGFCYSTSAGQVYVPFKVPARVAPTGIVASAGTHFALNDTAGNPIAGTGVALNDAWSGGAAINITGLSGLVAGNGTNGAFANAAATLIFTGAEL